MSSRRRNEVIGRHIAYTNVTHSRKRNSPHHKLLGRRWRLCQTLDKLPLVRYIEQTKVLVHRCLNQCPDKRRTGDGTPAAPIHRYALVIEPIHLIIGQPHRRLAVDLLNGLLALTNDGIVGALFSIKSCFQTRLSTIEVH